MIDQRDDEEDRIEPLCGVESIGRQIKEAEQARHHIEFDKLGDHLDALQRALSKLSI